MTAAYHIHHHTLLDGKPGFATADVPVVRIDGSGKDKMPLASLQNDLAELRKIGGAKGIVDTGLIEIGKSTKDRSIFAIKMGHGAKHKVFINGCHHAREWVSVEVPYLLAKYLVENYEKDPTDPKKKRIKHLLENREIWIVPMCNPDGHMHTITDDRDWRTNMKEHEFLEDQEIVAKSIDPVPPRKIKIKKGQYIGVDINRNYPHPNWGLEAYHPGSTTARSTTRDPAEGNTWCGPSAASETETQVIHKLHDKEKFRGYLTCHNYSQLLLYPENDEAAGNAFIQAVGAGMHRLIGEKGNPYEYGRPRDILYRLTGGSREYQYHVMPGRPCYTVELRPGRGEFERSFSRLPAAEIEPNFQEMLAASLALINCAGFDAPAGKATVKLKSADPVAQVVRNGIEAFKSW